MSTETSPRRPVLRYHGGKWRVERPALADGARERTEVLWLNPAAAAALRVHAMPLFGEARP